ncbi:M13 family metallopeptidase [Thalassolituus hydrocarboniclasticus]|uniref:M13 family metallopeptidase n=1 Tax=Thalassolituus hydrocarboniclasticus TaxID=2742796 RepID=A0ABY6ADS1_9GAMM|nr:M13 family metallopeptidase [Thalassolituus hydrocarboniclasticus]UXD88713.1 M13 family metallopeptidase [Thalassolituus hydrocarboniclasticus]
MTMMVSLLRTSTRLIALCAAVPLVLFSNGCSTGTDNNSAQELQAIPQLSGKAALGSWGVQTANISSDIKPGDDFYGYVNEGWLKTAEFPAGIPRMDSFVELALKAETDIREIVADATEKPENSNQQQIAALYTSYTDLDTLEKQGLQPVKDKLAAIAAATQRGELAALMQQPGYNAIADLNVQIDTRDPSRYILALRQGGLGMPAREYYLLDEAPYPAHRQAYADYISDLFKMANMPEMQALVADIVQFEHALADAQWSNSEMRNPVRMTRYMSLAELAEYAPGIDWLAMLNSLMVAPNEPLHKDVIVVVNTDSALQKIANIFQTTDFNVLQAYMSFHVLDNYADYLAKPWRDRHFAFYGKQLQGLAEQRSLEQNAIALLNGYLGEVVGQEYVKRHFPAEYRQSLMVYVNYLKNAFRERLQAPGWMDDATRKQALEKLSMLKTEIGYPTRWHDYSALELKKDDLIGNIDRLYGWLMNDTLAKLHEPVREWEWSYSPQQVNAYYSPPQNEIVFLAAILQPPFFDPNADFAVNFGAILTVIGHETSHGFDDQGSQYDGTGRLRNWWSEASAKEFKKRGDQLVAQYETFEPVPGAHINGRLTLGENIADLGGISVAYHALQNYIRDHYPDGAPVLDGFSAEQRFFLSWAQMWRSKRTEDYQRQLLLNDPHSPGRFRANGTVRNLDAWYQAFDVGPDAALYLPPDQRITTW